jgi:glycosyltransferase involved in cell wall biosynthesis
MNVQSCPGTVLMVHNRYQQPGGEDAVFEAEVALLRARGHKVITMVLDNDDIPRQRSVLAAGRLALRTIWSRESAAHVRALIETYQPDLAHFHNIFPLVSPAALHTCRSLGVPVVMTLHNYRLICPAATLYRDGAICELCVGRTPWPSVIHSCYRGSHGQSAVVAGMLSVHRLRHTWQRDVSTYVALTRFARAKLIAGGLPASRIVVKPNFLTHDPGLGQADGDFALFVGRLDQTKGIDRLLHAWTTERVGVPLRIAGDGPLADMVQEAVVRNSHIIWLGRLERSAVLDLMRQARVLVFPSVWYEGFPVTLVEALACGLPVVAPRIGAMAEIIRDGETGLLYAPPTTDANGHHIVSAARQVMDDQRLRASLSQAARDDYLAHYTAESGYRQLLATYARARAV